MDIKLNSLELVFEFVFSLQSAQFVCDTDMHLITNGQNPKTDGIRIGHLRSNPARKLQIYCYIFSPTTVPLKF